VADGTVRTENLTSSRTQLIQAKQGKITLLLLFLLLPSLLLLLLLLLGAAAAVAAAL
jgi:hypothetical protein